MAGLVPAIHALAGFSNRFGSPMDREKFLPLHADSIDYTFSFTANEEAARAQFEQLAIDTYDFLVSEAAPAWGPSSVFQAYSSRPYLYRRDLELPPQLDERWNAWAKEYEALKARNPRLELRDAMHRISESQ